MLKISLLFKKNTNFTGTIKKTKRQLKRQKLRLKLRLNYDKITIKLRLKRQKFSGYYFYINLNI